MTHEIIFTISVFDGFSSKSNEVMFEVTTSVYDLLTKLEFAILLQDTHSCLS